MFGSKDRNQSRSSGIPCQLGTVLYLLGALVLTLGSFDAVQTAPDILLNTVVLGTLSSLFIVYSLLGMIFSRNLS
jgi:hypothetical protein